MARSAGSPLKTRTAGSFFEGVNRRHRAGGVGGKFEFAGCQQPAGEDDLDAHVHGPVGVADLVFGEHLEKSAGGVGRHGDEAADQLSIGGRIVNGVGDEGDSPGADAREFHQHDALKTLPPAPLAEDRENLFGGAVDAFDEGEVFDEVLGLGQNLAADEKAAQQP